MDDFTKKLVKWAVIGIVVVIVLITLAPFVIIDEGHRGLVFKMGAIQQEILKPGLHPRIPLVERVEELDIRPLKVEYLIKVDSDGAITKDNQTIGATVNIFYKYKDTDLVQMWSEIGTDITEGIVVKTVQTSLKEVVGNYDIFTIAQTREKIQGEVVAKVAEALEAYPVDLDKLLISNYDWSPEFDAQIAETMKLAQQVRQAEQNKLKVEQEQGEKIKIAEADKQSRITLAEGLKAEAELLAEAKRLEGKGIEDYNASVATNWVIELKKLELNIEAKRVEKWDGKYVPNNMYGPIPVDTQGGVQGQQ